MDATFATLAVALSGAALAGFVQGITGFAFALVALSVWAWGLPPEIAAQLAVFGGLLGQFVSFLQVRGGYEWRRILPLVAGGLVGVPIGAFLLHHADPVRFRFAIGIFLTFYGGYGLIARNPALVKGGGRPLDAVAGFIGGVLGGLGGMSGFLPAMWTQLRGWSRDLRRATMQAYNIAMHVFTLSVYAATGAFNLQALKLLAVTAPALVVAGLFGARVYHRFSEQSFSRFVLGLLLLSGLAMIYGSARALWG